ncbi:unnamed protein product [Chrysodeixis includens]|uniref:Uncharacterized protein n=1 Tax=Chrysodeixis includens TaxID=689277 RepID=A0A9N8Q2U5_CHRIL|nr:unnamed protein product [Chrysodeixis includens]
MENNLKDVEYEQIDQLYDECLKYLEASKQFTEDFSNNNEEPHYESIKEKVEETNPKTVYSLENEKSNESLDSVISDPKSERLRKLSKQLPKIIITQSTTSLDYKEEMKIVPMRNVKSKSDHHLPKVNRVLTNNRSVPKIDFVPKIDGSMSTMDRRTPIVMKPFNHVPPQKKQVTNNGFRHPSPTRTRPGYGNHPKRLVSKTGMENVALISNVPFEKIRLLNDTFHTLINLRWRWIVIGTIVVHFAIWLVFAVFWYITAMAHYDFEPDPPKRTCVTGGKDFVTIFLASVEAQTTIGFGDRAIDEECPESIFLFIMQLILGTGLSGVLTCVVYAKLTRPEKLSRDGVGFSKKAVISMRDGRLCLMIRAWDLNYDHIISSEFTAHFVNTYRSKEGEVIRYYARSLSLQQRQFLLWPVTLVHVIDETSPLYGWTPELMAHNR